MDAMWRTGRFHRKLPNLLSPVLYLVVFFVEVGGVSVHLEKRTRLRRTDQQLLTQVCCIYLHA